MTYEKSNHIPGRPEEAGTSLPFVCHFELEFPTEKRFLDGHLLKVLENLEGAVQAAGVAGGRPPPPAIDLERVRVALREALANAAEHGNLYDPASCIRVRGRADGDQLRLEIEDQGEGFDLSQVSQDAQSQGKRRERGRGIPFMRGLSDSLRFEEGGRRVVLEFLRKEEESS